MFRCAQELVQENSHDLLVTPKGHVKGFLNQGWGLLGYRYSQNILNHQPLKRNLVPDALGTALQIPRVSGLEPAVLVSGAFLVRFKGLYVDRSGLFLRLDGFYVGLDWSSPTSKRIGKPA